MILAIILGIVLALLIVPIIIAYIMAIKSGDINELNDEVMNKRYGSKKGDIK